MDRQREAKRPSMAKKDADTVSVGVREKERASGRARE